MAADVVLALILAGVVLTTAGESQRYAARLLTELHEQLRRPQVTERSSPSGRVITPH